MGRFKCVSAARARAVLAVAAMALGVAGCDLPRSIADRGPLPEGMLSSGASADYASVGPSTLARGNRRGGAVEDYGRLGTGQPSRVSLPGQLTLPTVTGSRVVRLDYKDTDAGKLVREVVRDVLGLPIQVDPAVSGRVSLVTQEPVPISEVPQRLDDALRPLGLGIASMGGTVRAGRIADLEAARGGTQEMQVIQLAGTSAADVIAAAQPNLPEGVQLRPTPNGRGLIATGPAQGIAAVQDLVKLFDSDTMRGRSFGLYPLANAAPSVVVQALEQIMAGEPGATVMPVQRSNAVLVVTNRPAALQRAKQAIQRLDVAPQGMASLHVVPMMHRRATELADVVARAFGSPTSAPAASRSSPVGNFGALAVGGAKNGTSGVETRVPGAPAGLPDRAPETPPSAPVEAQAGQNGQGGQPYWEKLGLSAPVSVQADPGRNALLVLAAPNDANAVIAAIRRLDQPQRQVFIEAVIAEVSLTDEMRFGINYSINMGNAVLSQMSPLLNKDTNMGGLSFVLHNSNADMVVRALSDVTDVRVVSAPRLLVLDNETATLQVGNQVPIMTQTQQSTQSAGSPIVSSVEMRDTGVILAVRPRVGAGGSISLDLFQEVSDAVATGSSGINSPTIEMRRLQSTVAARSGDTIALGGLMRDSGRRQRNGTPLLSDIPVLGALFSTREQKNERTELIVLLTSRLVDNAPQMNELVDELRKRMASLAPDVARNITPVARGSEPRPTPAREPKITLTN